MKTTPLEWINRNAALVAGVIIALPTIITYYPPMTDLPIHEGIIGILRHYGDKELFPVNIYELNIGHPNQLFYLLSWLASLPFGSRWGVKIVIALAQVAIFHSGARFADHLGRSRWGAMLLAPLALGFTYYWGLVANLIGFSALLYALPQLDRLVEEPSSRRALKACGLFVALFFAHESCFVVAGGAVVLFTFLKPLSIRGTTARLAPVVFAVTLSVIHRIWALSLVTPGLAIAPTTWMVMRQKIVNIPVVMFGSVSTEPLALVSLLFVLALATLWIARFRSDPSTDEPYVGRLNRTRGFVHRYRFETIALIYLVGYFTLPFNWVGTTLLHERFLGPALAILVICLSPKTEAPRLAKIASLALVPAILLIAWPQFADSNKTFQELDSVLSKIPKGSSVANITIDRMGGWGFRIYSAGTGIARSVSISGGRASLSLTNSPISPVLTRAPYRRDEFENRRFFGSYATFPKQDLDSWQYVLVQSRELYVRKAVELVLSRNGGVDVIVETGEFMVVRSRHCTVPFEQIPPRVDRHEATIREWMGWVEPGPNGYPTLTGKDVPLVVTPLTPPTPEDAPEKKQ